MYLTKITLIEVSDLADMVRHPFQANINNSHFDGLNQIYEETGAISKDDISDVLGSAILPSATDIERVDVANGWAAARYRAIVEVVITEPISGVQVGTRCILLGYTDRVDITFNNAIAEDTLLYINTVLTIRDDEVYRNGMTAIESKVISNNQLLSGIYSPANRGSEFVTRPQDVFTAINYLEELDVDGDLTSDARIQFSKGAKQSRRLNNIGSSYLHTLVDCDRNGALDAACYGNDCSVFSSGRNMRALNISKEQIISKNAVLSTLFNVAETGDTKSVTYGDLSVLTEHNDVNEVDDLTKVLSRSNGNYDYHAEELDGAFEETIIAVIIANAAPAILAEFALATITFTCSNADSYNGDNNYEILDSTTFVTGLEDCSQLEDGFINRFQTEVYKHISKENQLIVSLEVECEISGVTRVRVAIGSHSDFQEYVLPTFADSNLVPVITQDVANVEHMANSYMNLRRNIDDIENDSKFYGSSATLNMGSRDYNPTYRDSNVNSILGFDSDGIL